MLLHFQFLLPPLSATSTTTTHNFFE